MAHQAREEYLTVNGARLWAATQGSGAPAVLCHGGPGLWDDLSPVADMVDDLLTVHRYDQRGCGRSQDVEPYRVETAVADLDALREAWQHEAWIVGGHSWGADLALAYALEFPSRVRALILINGTGVVDDWHFEYRAAADARLTPAERRRRADLSEFKRTLPPTDFAQYEDEYLQLSWRSDFADPEEGQRVLATEPRPFSPNYAANRRLNEDWRGILSSGGLESKLAALDAPALVVHGDMDPRPMRLAERTHRLLALSRLVVIGGAGHMPWKERPEDLRIALRSFVRDVVDESR